MFLARFGSIDYNRNMNRQKFIILYIAPIFAWMGFIFLLSTIPNLKSELPDLWDLILRKIAHLVEFGILAWLLARPIFPYGQKHKMPVWESALTVIILAILYAASDELHQTFVIGRTGSFWDVGIDGVGVVVGTYLYQRIFIDSKNQSQ